MRPISSTAVVATIVLFLVNFMTSSALVTLDSSKWFFPHAALPIAMRAAIACYGFSISGGGEPLLGRRILD